MDSAGSSKAGGDAWARIRGTDESLHVQYIYVFPPAKHQSCSLAPTNTSLPHPFQKGKVVFFKELEPENLETRVTTGLVDGESSARLKLTRH